MIKVTVKSVFRGKNEEEIKKGFNEKFLEYIVHKLKVEKNIEKID